MIVARNSSAWRSSDSWSWRRQRTRKPTSVDQSVSSKAVRAAATAESMSAGVPSATTPSTSSVAGFTFSNVPPSDASTSFPPISRRSSRQVPSLMWPPVVTCLRQALNPISMVRTRIQSDRMCDAVGMREAAESARRSSAVR